MDTTVSARIPLETRRQAAPILERIGASTTRLITSAFDYLIATGTLPQAVPSSEASAAEVEAYLSASTATAPASFWEELGARDYDDLISEGRMRDYEALA